MTKARDLADLIAAGNPLADGAISVAEISDLTASAAEINKLDGLVASTAELNNVVGTTSALQTQLDNISVTSGSLTKSFASGETASITLAQAISPAPVVSATKEVPQVGVVSKGAWDVNASASNYDLHNTAYATTLTPGGVGYLDLGSATYASKSFSVASQITGPLGTAFSTDGTKMYVCGESGFVYQYTLSTAWDASTASYSTSWDGTGVTSNIGGLHFKTDGTVLFLACPLGDEIRRVNLSTAWDVSTATDQNSNFNVNSYDTSIQGLWFKPDGTKMYMIGQNSYRVQGFNLSTAWDHTTATASGSKSVGVLDNSPQGVAFSSDGTKMYIAGGTNTKVFQYLLSTAWDVTTASGAGPVFLDVSGQDTQSTLKDVTFGNDGNILYITSKGGSSVFQYDTSAPALVLGTGSFASTDVGKRIVGNGGDVTLTSTAGAYDTYRWFSLY
jgi:sugar lactone lactonase YvrE